LFSRRLEFDLRPNKLADLLSRKNRDENNVIDLILSNPTQVGFNYPFDQIREAYAASSFAVYSPDPRGTPEARAAVSRYYGERGQDVPPEDVIITASTSEAYSFLFRLLADPGDRVLVPEPGYPLFDYLLRLDGLLPVSLRMRYSQGWWYDFDSAVFDESIKAAIIVSPSNPAGNYIRRDEWAFMIGKCAGKGIGLICDEVFYDFPHLDVEPEVDLAEETGALTFVLNGFSKTAGLPQVKMSWIVVRGPRELKQDALEKLELISDSYLSPSTVVQGAAAAIFKLAPGIRSQVQQRVRGNMAFLEKAVRGSPIDCLQTEGGWSAIVRLPGIISGSDWALQILDLSNILTHPGSFYGMEGRSYLVLSLLPETENFREGISRLLEAVSRRVGQ
jgi:alanine-synthesizing transaminase